MLDDKKTYSNPQQSIGAMFDYSTTSGTSRISQDITDALGGTLHAKGQAFTNGSYALDVGIGKQSGSTVSGVKVHISNGNPFGLNEPLGNNISGNIETDIMSLFNIFKNPQTPDNTKLIALGKIKNKYNLDISENEIQQLGPINSLRAFAIGNRDIVNNNILINLGFKIRGGKIILPSDFIGDKKDIDKVANSIIKLSVGGKFSVKDQNTQIGLGVEVFTRLDVQLDDSIIMEYLAHKDWVSSTQRVSLIKNITRDAQGNVIGIVLVAEAKNGLPGVGFGINKIKPSGNINRFTIKIMQNGGISISLGNQSLVLGDINTESSINLGKLLPMFSNIITQNVGDNVTNDEGEVFANYEKIFQSVGKDGESRKVVKKICEKLGRLGDYIGLEFTNPIISQFSKIENLQSLNNWLDKNTDFLIENSSKIRYMKFSSGNKNSSYDGVNKILNYNIVLGEPAKQLNKSVFQEKQYDYYISSDKPEEINAKITLSNSYILSYLEETSSKFQIHKGELTEYFKKIEIIGFDTLSDIEKEGLMDLILRMIKNGTISKLLYKRIIINDDSLFNFSVSLNSGVKTLSIEKQVLGNIGKSNLDYSIDSNKNTTRLQIEKPQLEGLFTGVSLEDKERIIKSLSDISEFQILPDNDVRLLCHTYIGDNGKLYLSESFFKKIKSDKVHFNELMGVFSRAKVEYLNELDDEINTKFGANEAEIIKLSRGAGENTFYEFRPTTDIQTTNGTKKVKYDIFDHGNVRIDSFEVELTKENDIKITVQGKLYFIDDLIFQTTYRHILQALTGMTGRRRTGDTTSIGGIINMLLSHKT